MTRILFCVVPEKGHLNPCIGPAQHLRAAGCEVAFYAPADISGQLDGAGGFAFLGPRGTPQRPDTSRGASFAANIQDAAWLRRWIHDLLVARAADLVDDIRACIRQWRPDAVAIDPLLYAAAIAAEREHLPWAALSNSLNPVLPDTLDSELLRTVRALAPERDRLFARYGLRARFRGCDVLSPHLTVAFTTEALVGAPPPGVRLLGPSLPTGPRGDEPAFAWERLDPARPLVYLSLGSQLYHHPDIHAKVARAVRATAAQLVLSVGELAHSAQLPALDEDVIAVRYAPQLALLRRAAAFINHGGANSVMESLACGVPMLLSPLCNDQFHCAYFVTRAGAGHQIDLRLATAADIGAALRPLLQGAYRAQTARIAASYARDGAAQAARLLIALASGNRLETMS